MLINETPDIVVPYEPLQPSERAGSEQGIRAMKSEVTFGRADLRQEAEHRTFLKLSQEYFEWMDEEITQLCGFTIASIANMGLSDYVAHTVGLATQIGQDEGGIYFLRDAAGNAAAMGGLRRLPSGGAEIVRIYTRPQYRGGGHGWAMVQGLIGEARRLGYRELFLDTGVFMKSAQKIYREAGFSACAPYAGAEPPEALMPYWLYLKRSLEHTSA